MPPEQLVTLDVTDAGVALLRLNRPEKHNALSQEMISAVIDYLDEIRATPSVRAVLIEGNGKSFSAGLDLEWLRFSEDYTHSDHVEDARLVDEMLHRLNALEQLTIALVNGAAIGNALGIIAACDVAVAVKWAEFRFAEVRLGLSPTTIAPYIVRAIPPRWARMLFATGKAFDAALARDIGLIHYIAEDLGALHAQADELVDVAFHAAPKAVRASKKLVDEVIWGDIDGGMRRRMADRFAHERAGEEAKEGIAAFLAKRKADWAN